MLEYLVWSLVILCLLAFMVLKITRTAGFNRNFMLVVIAVCAAMVVAFPYLMFSLGTSKVVVVYLFIAVVSVGLAGIKFKPDQILFKKESGEPALAPHEQWLLADMDESAASAEPDAVSKIEEQPSEPVPKLVDTEASSLSEENAIEAEEEKETEDQAGAGQTEEPAAEEEPEVESEPESLLADEPKADDDAAEVNPEIIKAEEKVEEIEVLEGKLDIEDKTETTGIEEIEKSEAIVKPEEAEDNTGEEVESAAEDMAVEQYPEVTVDEPGHAEESPAGPGDEVSQELQAGDSIKGSVGEEPEDKTDQVEGEILDQVDDGEAVPAAAEPVSLDMNDLIERGFDAKNKGNLKMAIIEFNRAMEICRDLYLFYLLGTELGELYKQSGLYQEAIRILIKTQTVVSSPDEYNIIDAEISYLEKVHDLLKAEGLPGLPYSEIPESIRANAQRRVSEK